MLTTPGFHRIDYVIWGIVRQKWGPSLLPPPDVVINEIYESGDGPTWYELYNLTDSTLDTSKWRFASRSTGYVHLPMDNMLPGEYVILCDSKEQFENKWSLPEGIRCFEFVVGAPGELLLLDNTPNELGVVEYILDRSVLEPGHSWSRYVGGYYTDSWSRYMGSYGTDNYFANYFYDESHPTPGRPNSRVKGEGGVGDIIYGIAGIIAIVIIWAYARVRK